MSNTYITGTGLYTLSKINVFNNIKKGATNWEIDGNNTGVAIGTDLDFIFQAGSKYSELAIYSVSDAVGGGFSCNIYHGPTPTLCTIDTLKSIAVGTVVDSVSYQNITNYFPVIKITIPTALFHDMSLGVYRG